MARILDLLREVAHQAPGPERVAVHGLIGEIVSMASAGDRTTVTLHNGDECWLSTYPAALWRVVANVVDNAVRAAGHGGRVEISVGVPTEIAPGDQPHRVVIEVTDDGPGFGQAPAGTASLGLGIAVSLARQCAGTVTILPVDPHGVRVRLEFPDLAARNAVANQPEGRP